jgi:uncharacterized membrane protein YdjX (TVP38/TMEM64 family)
MILASALTIAVAAAILHRDALHPELIGQWLRDAGAWGPVFFVGAYAVATVLFLPGSLLTILGGVLFGPWLGALYSLTGATIGATAAFLVARDLASDWVARKTGDHVRQFIEGVREEGWRFVAFVRLVPVFPFNLSNYALGLTGLRFAPYVIASFVCMAPGALAYAYLGHAGREALVGSETLIKTGSIALALLAVVVFLPRLWQRFQRIRLVEPQQLRKGATQGQTLVLDVRSAKEYVGDPGHIPGARNVPLPELEHWLRQLSGWRDKPIFLVCRTDKRSTEGAHLLLKHGFRRVAVVRGGMLAWQRLGLPVVSEERADAPSN